MKLYVAIQALTCATAFRLRSSSEAAQKDFLPDPFCKKGVVSSDLLSCCPDECGTCDTHALCSDPGKYNEITGKIADHCCSELVQEKAKSCEKVRPPCVLSEKYMKRLSSKSIKKLLKSQPSRHAANDCHKAVNQSRTSMKVGALHGQMKATLYNGEKTLRDATDIVNDVEEWVKGMDEKATEAITEAKAKLDTASERLDATGVSEETKLQDTIDSKKQAKKFYKQMQDNVDRVRNAIEAGKTDDERIEEDLEKAASKGNVDGMRLRVRKYMADSDQALEDAKALRKQRIAATKDYDCGAPPPVEHGAECKAGNTKYSQKCTVQCDEGYDEDTSANTLMCARQGKFGQKLYGEWFGIANCQPQNCGVPPSIDQAGQEKQEIVYPHAAIYTCAEGFTQDGEADGNKSFGIPCTSTGFFDRDPSQQCQPVRCGTPPRVAHAPPVKDEFVYHEVAMYKCDKGYTIDSTPGGLQNFSVVCQATGEFSQGETCTAVLCGTFPAIAKADALSDTAGKDSYGDEVDYSCRTGYTLTGEVGGQATFTLRCMETGEFRMTTGSSDLLPVCTPVSNGMSPRPLSEELPHGLDTPKEMFYGESQVVIAETGYSLDGKADSGRSFLLRTTAKGVYAGIKEFQRVDCGKPPEVANSVLLFAAATAKFGDEVRYNCKAGYSTDYTPAESSLSFAITCEDDGSFSRVEGEGECVNINDCIPHTCGAHGECVDLLEDYECDCERGYEEVVDEETGEKICGNIDDCGPSGCGVGSCEDLIEDYKCHCPDGYEQTYTGEEKTCTRVICGTPPELDHAQTVPIFKAYEKLTFQDEVLFQCLPGHTLDGKYPGKNHFTIKCRKNKMFTVPPNCKPVHCDEAPEISSAKRDKAGTFFNRTIKYTCDTGHTTDGTAEGDDSFTINCTEDGSYTEPGACQPVSCGEPDEAANAFRPSRELVYKDEVKYSCFEGFTLNGKADGKTTKVLECNKDGRIEGLENCNPVVCGDPPDLINVRHAAVPDMENVHYPQTVEITCDDGFAVGGLATNARSFIVKCQANGKFDRYNKRECQPVDCGPLPALAHASATAFPENGRLNFVQEATFTCAPGYRVGGEHDAPSTFKVQCLGNGAFSYPSPEMMCRNVNDCEQHTCGPRGQCVDEIGPAPAYHCDCQSGFEERVVNGEKYCGNVDDCGGRDCGPGVCKDLVNDYTCICPTGHFIGVEDGKKTCIPMKCAPRAPTVPDGKRLSSHSGAVTFPQTLRYECDDGHSTDGSSAEAKKRFQVSCLATGSLTEMFACRRVSCGSPHVLPFTRLLQPENIQASVVFGQTAKYKCLDGYTIGATPDGDTEFTVSCPASGVLSAPKVCAPIACGRAPRLPKARSSVAGVVTHGMSLMYECDAGYTLDGTVSGLTTFSRACKRDGTFSEIDKECKPLRAQARDVRGARRVQGGPTVYVGQSVTYRCNSGFSTNGGPGGATLFSSMLTTQGEFSPALPTACLEVKFLVQGQVRDARSGRGISGFTVRLGGGTAQTGPSGRYELRVGQGAQTLAVQKSGWIGASFEVTVNGNIRAGGAGDVLVSPSLGRDQWRATVGWGRTPYDIDTHVAWGSTRVFYERTYAFASGISGKLEKDDTNGYGPETLFWTGLGNCRGGAYWCDTKYTIHKYSSSGPWRDNTDMKVTLYTHDRVAGMWKITDCPGSISGPFWHVFTIDAATNRLKWHCRQGSSLVGLSAAVGNQSQVDFESYVGPFPGRYFRRSRQRGAHRGRLAAAQHHVEPAAGRFFRGSGHAGGQANASRRAA